MQKEHHCRCPWLDTSKEDYVAYHDQEWGVPLYDDHRLFEFITLESAQAGLSWYTILKKRDGYRSAFKNFVVEEVAKMTEDDVERLMLKVLFVIALKSPPLLITRNVLLRFKKSLAVSQITNGSLLVANRW